MFHVFTHIFIDIDMIENGSNLSTCTSHFQLRRRRLASSWHCSAEELAGLFRRGRLAFATGFPVCFACDVVGYTGTTFALSLGYFSTRALSFFTNASFNFGASHLTSTLPSVRSLSATSTRKHSTGRSFSARSPSGGQCSKCGFFGHLIWSSLRRWNHFDLMTLSGSSSSSSPASLA